MREILFRGKRKDNGEWEYGDAFHNHDGRCFVGELVVTAVSHNRFCDKYEIGINFADVDPETVGQFTGLTDMNGQKIFEGDIISGYDNNYVCEWDEGNVEFIVFDGKESFGIAYADYMHMEVIGNIHDNPELLEISE